MRTNTLGSISVNRTCYVPKRASLSVWSGEILSGQRLPRSTERVPVFVRGIYWLGAMPWGSTILLLHLPYMELSHVVFTSQPRCSNYFHTPGECIPIKVGQVGAMNGKLLFVSRKLIFAVPFLYHLFYIQNCLGRYYLLFLCLWPNSFIQHDRFQSWIR